LSDAQTTFHVSGSGIVAVIDTGVDPNHPALHPVLLPGYDFTRNENGADETADVPLSSPPSPGSPQWVNSRSAAKVDQSTAAVVDGSAGYSDFGHGTMVAGVIHLVAPSSLILPLKAFKSDGTGYLSDILRAIYVAVKSNAQVINMSFNLSSYSQEVKNAVQYANAQGVVCVAAAGNDGQNTVVYPAGLTNLVMGVASTTNNDQRSSFSNYGSQLVWLAAPGEGIVTTYPFGLYAAAWGTSFSTPFVAGTVALLEQMRGQCDQSDAGNAVANAVPLSSDLGHGRLDIYEAAEAWSNGASFQ
jgi:thermitase